MQHPKHPSTQKTACFSVCRDLILVPSFQVSEFSEPLHEITESASTNCRLTFLCRHFRLPTAATVARATKRCKVLGRAEVPQEEAPGATAILLVLQPFFGAGRHLEHDKIHHMIPHKTTHVKSNTSSTRTCTSMHPLAKTLD